MGRGPHFPVGPRLPDDPWITSGIVGVLPGAGLPVAPRDFVAHGSAGAVPTAVTVDNGSAAVVRTSVSRRGTGAGGEGAARRLVPVQGDGGGLGSQERVLGGVADPAGRQGGQTGAAARRHQGGD